MLTEKETLTVSETGFEPVGYHIQIRKNALNGRSKEIFTEPVLKLISALHQQKNKERVQLLDKRKLRQEKFDTGELPSYEDRHSEAVTGSWKVAPLPDDLLQRRVEITGPVNSAKMVINMLSRNDDGERADMAMLDFEDSMKPDWSNVIDGYHNVIGAVDNTLREEQGGKVYEINPDDKAGVMVRVRGLHLAENNILVNGEPASAGITDLAVAFYHTAKTLKAQGRTPKYYIPKCEHYLEARWWNDLFKLVQQLCGFPSGTLRATFLIETLTAAFQIEEILYEIREHAAGLNTGRWDKIFSDIKVLKAHPRHIMADRVTITMQKYWMENYAKRIVLICHKRGAFAMGGMSAFTPGKTGELREKQTRKVAEDKAWESGLGHDGCWVSHPYFIGVALRQFTKKNQLDVIPGYELYPDLIPSSEGPKSLDGLRTNVRVGIGYMNGWLQGIGCVAWDNLMEDLATLEISRAQTWQWKHHRVILREGMTVDDVLISRIFDEELEKIRQEAKELISDGAQLQKVTEGFERAAAEARRIFLQDELADFLAMGSDPA
ncbi:MAG: malate synthase [Balneolia bacterium]|nr:malate synthase [Balneolia bacterium]